VTRLLLSLKATNDSRYEMQYHKDVQGLIYGLIRGSEYDVHEKHGYKFFSFSNIFPFSDLRKGDNRSLLIASPNDNFISYLKDQFEYLHDIRIGAMTFKIENCKKLHNNLPDGPTSLITATPIVCNIHRYRFEEVDALDLVNGHATKYWRSNLPVDLFLKQIEANLIKKYNAYNNIVSAEVKEQKQPPSLFYRSRFLKQVAIPLSMGQSRYSPIMIGTCWRFGITNPELAAFALDIGLGESNSLGFGFMNPVRMN
jgi:CRISPR-associated endoribonuclease Cas6